MLIYIYQPPLIHCCTPLCVAGTQLQPPLQQEISLGPQPQEQEGSGAIWPAMICFSSSLLKIFKFFILFHHFCLIIIITCFHLCHDGCRGLVGRCFGYKFVQNLYYPVPNAFGIGRKRPFFR